MSAKDFLTVVICMAVTLVWCTCLIVSLVTNQYQPALIASGPMAGVVTFVTGLSLVRRSGGVG